MGREVLVVLFAGAVCCSVVLLLASHRTDGLGVSVEIERSSSNSSDSCCSGQLSTPYQSNPNEDRQVSGNSVSDEVLSDSVDITILKFGENMTCTETWFIPSTGSGSCECGSTRGGIVECDTNSKKVNLLQCYCMTFSIDGSMLVVGPCLYGCVMQNDHNPYYPLPSNTSELSAFCNNYNREGQLCGRCKPGFALPVYSYNLT